MNLTTLVPPSEESSHSVETRVRGDSTNQPTLSSFNPYLNYDRNNNTTGVGHPFSSVADSSLDNLVGDSNEVELRVSAHSLGNVDLARIKTNEDEAKFSDGTAAFLSNSMAHNFSLPAPKSPRLTLGRPPKASLPNTASHELVLNRASPISTENLLHGTASTPITEYVDIELKQNELRYAVENRIRSLEQTLSIRDDEILHLQIQLHKIEEDYQYNYNLISERDEALQESSVQLRCLYEDLKRSTVQAGVREEKLHRYQNELSEMRQRVRDVEQDRETAIRCIQKEYLIKEKHLQDAFNAKEEILEEQRQRVHEHYMQQLRELEESRQEMEGHTASITSEWMENYKQSMQRLQTQLEEAQKRLKSLIEKNKELTSQARSSEEEVKLLKHQLVKEEQRQNASMEEFLQTNRKLESQLAQTNSILNKTLATTEDAIREETKKNRRLELENAQLQTSLSEVEERIQLLFSERQEESAVFSTERDVLKSINQKLHREMDRARSAWREKEQQLQASLASKADELDCCIQQKQQVKLLCETAQHRLSEKAREVAEQQKELVRLLEEVERWKAAESTTALKGEQEVRKLQEKVLSLDLALQAARDEAEVSRHNAISAQQRTQEEVVRLTRELHASEAARHLLVNEFHPSQDHDVQENVINALRHEKEILERRVLELEQTNSQIREQVANFTLELQNDPVVKSAREMHRRVDQLQRDLLDSRDSNERLQRLLKEKEDELARYQVDLLRTRISLSGGEDCDVTPDALNMGLYSALGQGRSDRSKPLSRSQSKDCGCREKKCARSCESHLAGTCTCGDANDSNASEVTESGVSSHDRNSKSKENSLTNRDRKKGNTHVSVVPSPGHSSCANRSNVNCSLSTEGLLKESELWRKKYYQLEQHVQKLFLERDHYFRKLQLAKQDVASLTSEKQSLLDLNSLLKAQLREAYRAAYEANTVTKNTFLVPSEMEIKPGSLDEQGVTPASLGRPSVASALHPNREGGLSGERFLTRPSLQTTTSKNGKLFSLPAKKMSSATRQSNPGLSHFSQHDSAECNSFLLTPSTTLVCPDALQQERLKNLEDEIRLVKLQIAASTHQEQQSQPQPQPQPPSQSQTKTTTPNSRRGLATENGTSVIRKGAQAIRHYGRQ